MSKVYSYEDCQPVIKEAWFKAIKHLEDALGAQYKHNATDHAWGKFQYSVEQDIVFKMKCDLCGKVDGECDFTEVMINSHDFINICDDCFEARNIGEEQ